MVLFAIAMPAAAAPQNVAIFHFQLIDTSRQRATNGPNAGESKRIETISNTDESSFRTLSLPVRNRLLQPRFGDPR